MTDLDNLAFSDKWIQQHFLGAEIGVLAWNMELRACYWNPAAERMFGYAQEEALGKHAWELIVPPDVKSYALNVFEALKAGAPAGRYSVNENVRKDGARIICEWHNTPLFDDDQQMIGAASIVQDVTGRLRTQEKLQLFKSAIEQMQDAVIIAGAREDDYPIQYVNPAFEKITGYSAAEARGRNCRFLQGEGTEPASITKIRKAVRANKSVKTRITNYRKDGTPFYHDLSITPVHARGNGVSHFIGVQRDVTAERVSELQAIRLQKNDALSEFVGALAHDMNNMLATLRLNLELAAMPAIEQDQRLERLDACLRVAERAGNVMWSLLTYSKRQPFQQELVDIAEIVRESVSLFKGVLGDRITLNTEMADGLTVCVDASQLQNAIINLLLNAKEAIGETGVISIEAKRLVVSDVAIAAGGEAATPGDYVELQITDDGCGISPDVINKIFDPFFSTKRKGDGHGLGLSSVYGFARQSRGYVSVESTEKKGTTFCLLLPFQTARAPATTEAPARIGVVAGGKRVLVVEDEAELRSAIVAQLRAMGFRADASPGAPDAIAKLATQNRYDVVITDLKLGGDARGVQVIQAAEKAGEKSPVVLVSGHFNLDSIAALFDQSRITLLRKPFGQQDLANAMKVALNSANGYFD